jgi:hypothetical protein
VIEFKVVQEDSFHEDVFLMEISLEILVGLPLKQVTTRKN